MNDNLEDFQGYIDLDLITEERWRIWAEICKHIPKGTEQSDLIHKIIFEND